MSRPYIEHGGHRFVLQDCGHLVRSDLHVCSHCEPLSLSVVDAEASGLDACPDTDPAPATSTEDEDLQALLDQVATTGEMPQ